MRDIKNMMIMKKVLRNTALACVIGVAGASYGCSSVNYAQVASAGVTALQAATLSDAYIEQMVGQYIEQLDAESTIAGPNDPYAVRLNRITSSFNNKNGINIKVYKTKDVNAFAVANGSIRVYSGLMDIMTDEEVLGVIGHEIGHIHNKDTKDAFRNALLTSAVRQGLASAGGRVGALSASELGALGEALMSSQYSQKQELEADEYGYEFLKSHGVNPWAMALSLGKLRQMEQQGGAKSSAMQQLFSTHPDIEKRMGRLEQRAKKEGYANPAETGAGFALPAGGKTQGSSSTQGKTDANWMF